VKGLLTGQQDNVKVPITLEIPRALLQTYQAIAAKWNVPLETCLQQLAQVGIQKSMNESMKLDLTNSNTLTEITKKSGIDLSPLTDGLGKISTLVGQLESLQKVFEDGQGTPPKNQ
jgi:hypothetical protein